MYKFYKRIVFVVDRAILGVIEFIESRTYLGEGVNAYNALSLAITGYGLVMISLLLMIWLGSNVPYVLTLFICLICNLVVFRVIFVCLCLGSRRALETTNMEGDLYMSCVNKLGIQSVQWAGTDKSLNRIFELLTSNGIDAALRREEETLYIDTYIQEYRESNDKYGKTYVTVTTDDKQILELSFGDWVVVTRSGFLCSYSCPEYLSFLLDV